MFYTEINYLFWSHLSLRKKKTIKEKYYLQRGFQRWSFVSILTCGDHFCIRTYHKVELKYFEGDTILSSRSETLNIPLSLGRCQGHHHGCNLCVVFHPKVQ